MGYTPQTSRLCGVFSCTSNENCHSQGACNVTSGTCTCAAGYSGESCSVFAGPCTGQQQSSGKQPMCCPTGAVDSDGNCCTSGVVSESEGCCAASPRGLLTLDRNGACCAGHLDACGICNGNGTAVDVGGACCTGSLDAGGRCCKPPAALDDFGVCGGNSSTGLLQLQLSATVSTASLQDQGGSANIALSQGLRQRVATGLGLLAAQCSLTGGPVPAASAQATATRVLLAAAAASAQWVAATVTVAPPYGSMPYGKLLEKLVSEDGLATGSDGLSNVTLVGAYKTGQAGNGICEVGELGSTANATASGDCQATALALPASANTRPCSGKGMPVAAARECVCFTGYAGPGCGACAEGYGPLAGVCQRTPEGFAAEARVKASQDKVSALNLAIYISTGVMAALCCLAGCLVLGCYVRRKRQLSCDGFCDPEVAAARELSLEKQLIADEAAWWAKAASVYPGHHATGCSPQLQHYRDLYIEFGGGKDEKPTKKLIQDDVSYTLPARACKPDASRPLKRPFTSAVTSFGGTLAGAASAAGASMMYDTEGRRRTLFGGGYKTVAIPAVSKHRAVVPPAEAAAMPAADVAGDDPAVDPRRISDMWDQSGSRRKLSAYRIEADRMAAEQREAEAAARAIAKQQVAEGEAAAAAAAEAAARDASAKAAAVSLVSLYDEFGQRQTSRFQQPSRPSSKRHRPKSRGRQSATLAKTGATRQAILAEIDKHLSEKQLRS